MKKGTFLMYETKPWPKFYEGVPESIPFYLTLSKSIFALTLDAFYGKFNEILDKMMTLTLILTKIADYLSLLKRFGFYVTRGRKIPKVPADPRVKWWKELMAGDSHAVPAADIDTDDLAVMLYSGGTTGVPKGIMLSNMNFISEGMQVAEWAKLGGGDSMLAMLPIFH